MGIINSAGMERPNFNQLFTVEAATPIDSAKCFCVRFLFEYNISVILSFMVIISPPPYKFLNGY